jgi:hypothetical protein
MGYALDRGSRQTSFRALLQNSAPAVLLAIAVLVPFADSAFTIDDTLFLEQASHALSDPLHPTAFETVWSEAHVPQRMSQIMPSGAVAAWALVPAALADGSERIAHATQLGALILAIVATVSIALRLGLGSGPATLAGLLLASTPAALAMAGTAMPDVMAMALGVAGLERLLAWRDGRRIHQGIAAAVLLGLAPLARSHLFLVIGVGVLFLNPDPLSWSGWRQRWTTWLPIAGALTTAGVLAWVTRDPLSAGGNLASAAQLFSAPKYVAVNTVAFATHWVVALPLGVTWLAVRLPAIARRWWLLGMAAAGAAVTLITSPWGGRSWLLQTVPPATIGAAVLVDIFLDAWERRDSIQLVLGAWLLVALPIAIYLHLPSKYLLASAPAAAIVVARALARVPTRLGQWATRAALVAGVVLGVAILRANAAFSDIGRRAATELIAPNVAAGRPVWFAGNWGFKWYAQRAGGRILTFTPPYPAPGHLIVVAHNAEPGYGIIRMLTELYPHATLLTWIEDRTPGGRTMSHVTGAGFFSNAWGYLPWTWGSDLLERFDLWRID